VSINIRNFSPVNAGVSAQAFAYTVESNIEDVLDEGFFNPIRRHLRAGDDIKICKIATANGDVAISRLHKIMNLVVIEVNPDNIKVKQIGETIKFNFNVNKNWHVENTSGRWFRVVDANGIGITGNISKDEAHQIVSGDKPLILAKAG